MPLESGYSKETIGHNIGEMEKSGHNPLQSIAASYANARQSAKEEHKPDVVSSLEPSSSVTS